jgi:ATP-binding cassette, subfamily B, bacterial
MGSTLTLIRPYLFAHRWAFAWIIGELIVINLFELLKPWPLKVVIDEILSDRGGAFLRSLNWSPTTLLVLTCLTLVMVHIMAGGLTILYNYTTIRLGQKLVHALRHDLYEHVQRMSLAFHARRSLGDLLYRVSSDTFAIQSLVMNGVFPLLSSVVLLAGMAIVMWRMDWLLTLTALMVCPVLFVAIACLNQRIHRAALQARHKEGQVYSVVQGGLSSIRIIQAYTKEEQEHQRFMAVSEESLAAGLRLYTLQTSLSAIVTVTIAGGTAAVIAIGGAHVLKTELTLGELVVFISYLASLYTPINTMVQSNSLLQDSLAGIERVAELLRERQDLRDGQLSTPRLSGRIAFEGIDFSYRPSQPVLRDISLDIQPGQRVAIVGPTGAGKSTLVSLLPRFYDPQEGRVLLDGTDIRTFRLKELRRQIALVLQPPLLLPVSIRENIAYGLPEASDEQIQEAARSSQAHDFIMQMPEGYATQLGEQGGTLSEGQRQRLTIARAILLDAPILILDEPTSSLDLQTEALMMKALERLMRGRTTFIIAHRLTTIRHADLVLVLKDGRIIQQGTPEQLIVSEGLFRDLWTEHCLTDSSTLQTKVTT